VDRLGVRGAGLREKSPMPPTPAQAWGLCDWSGALALRQAQENRGSGRPTVVIAVTTKGKGVSFMSNSVDWHGKGPNDDEYKVAMEELNAAYAALEQEEK
jgi:transketolase